jgi:hypothetical protein
MNEITNFTGYSQGPGLTGTSITTTTNGSGLTLNSNSTINYSNNLGLSTAITNSNNMVRQTKVAVFTVERNEDNKIISTTFLKELWVELKNETSLDLAVAKQLDKDYDPANTVIKQIYSVIF